MSRTAKARLLAAAKPEDEVKRALLLDVVIRERPAVLELLARENEPLLVRGDTLLVLDLGLDVVNRVRRLNLKRDGLASKAEGQGNDEAR